MPAVHVADLVPRRLAGEEVVDVERPAVAAQLAAGAEDAGLPLAHLGEGGHGEAGGDAALVAQRHHLVVDDVVVARPHAAAVRTVASAASMFSGVGGQATTSTGQPVSPVRRGSR